MATATYELTDSFQKISDGACFVQPKGAIVYWFGVTEPSDGYVLNPSIDGSSINYSGIYGAMWAKRGKTTTNDSPSTIKAIVTVV